MNIRIKVCGMVYPENIRAVATLEPDYMGFIFYPRSPRYAAGKSDPALLEILPGSIKKAGVFVNSQVSEIAGLADTYSLDVVQLHGNEPPDTCGRLREMGIRIIKSFGIDNNSTFERCRDYISCTDFFLFDTVTPGFGGSGRRFNWSNLENYSWEHPFFLSGGITTDDWQKILQISNPYMYGVDVNSGFEISPGVKDINKLGIFISEIRNKACNYE